MCVRVLMCVRVRACFCLRTLQRGHRALRALANRDASTRPGPGSCAEVKLRVLQFVKETEEIVLASNSSSLPLGEGFLAAKGIRLTDEELALARLSPSRETFSEEFLTGGDYAVRLAAQSSECHVLLVSGSRALN